MSEIPDWCSRDKILAIRRVNNIYNSKSHVLEVAVGDPRDWVVAEEADGEASNEQGGKITGGKDGTKCPKIFMGKFRSGVGIRFGGPTFVLGRGRSGFAVQSGRFSHGSIAFFYIAILCCKW